MNKQEFNNNINKIYDFVSALYLDIHHDELDVNIKKYKNILAKFRRILMKEYKY